MQKIMSNIVDASCLAWNKITKPFGSEMNVCILGMQGAGKTVFITQLVYSLKRKYGIDTVRGIDLASEQYCADILDQLEGSENGVPSWPESTKQGVPQKLQFSVHTDDFNGKFLLYDIAGQDIDEFFCAGAPQTPVQEEIYKQIQYSDLLIFLFDLTAFGKSQNRKEQQRNWWIFERFLSYCQDFNIHGLVILSKADEFSDLTVRHYGDDAYINNYICKKCKKLDVNMSQFHSSTMFCRAMVSVVTETKIENGEPKRVPKIHSDGCKLHSKGMSQLWQLVCKVNKDIHTTILR